MAVSLNSVVGFNSKNLQQQLRRCYVQGSTEITVTSWRRRKLESLCLSSSVSSAETDSEDSVAAPVDQNSSSSSSRLRRTAKERLRAGRKYSEAKAAAPSPKSEMGTNVLNAIRESEGGGKRGRRRSRLPEAPTNMLDDSKRGMPKQGLTFDFPGGVDLFVILVSFVLISAIMFATTYFVWKVGAIHFND